MISQTHRVATIAGGAKSHSHPNLALDRFRSVNSLIVAPNEIRFETRQLLETLLSYPDFAANAFVEFPGQGCG